MCWLVCDSGDGCGTGRRVGGRDLGLQELVDMFDHDHNGFVEEHELRAVLARLDFRPTPEQVCDPCGVVWVSSLEAATERRRC